MACLSAPYNVQGQRPIHPTDNNYPRPSTAARYSSHRSQQADLRASDQYPDPQQDSGAARMLAGENAQRFSIPEFIQLQHKGRIQE